MGTVTALCASCLSVSSWIVQKCYKVLWRAHNSCWIFKEKWIGMHVTRSTAAACKTSVLLLGQQLLPHPVSPLSLLPDTATLCNPLLCAATYLWNHRHLSCPLILLQLCAFLVPPIARCRSGQESCCWSLLPHLLWVLSVLGVQLTNASLRVNCPSIVCTFAEYSLHSAAFTCSGSLPGSNVLGVPKANAMAKCTVLAVEFASCIGNH